jgi:glucosamine kinase
MYFLAIDGGGTKTECAIGDRRGFLSRVVAGSCKLREVGVDAATANLRHCVTQALRLAHVRGDEVASTAAGMAGLSDPAMLAWLKETLGNLVSGKIVVSGDHEVAFEAAFPDGAPGILVIAGTGSIAYGRNEGGRTARAGGYGPKRSDEGSGRWIGKLALDSGLLFDEADSAADPASLFPAVVKLADGGSAEARDLLDRAGHELAKLAQAVALELGLKAPTVRIAGGVLQNSRIVQDGLHNGLQHHCPGARLDLARVNPLDGALTIARGGRLASAIQ